MVESGDPDFQWALPENEWDPMTLNYTSGTTSSPKGVVHCHRGLFIITVKLSPRLGRTQTARLSLDASDVPRQRLELPVRDPMLPFVSLKDDVGRRPTEKEMIEYCRGKLPNFMVPKTVLFIEELPKTSKFVWD
ncbi:putative 4-coumarate--CoA ligase [Rosa chinensis]|uniref:Putative 4-coumarate--CoA ligase n=1 Tax=Rosa chinensis TaxID=74649 RepID=A0A2P6R144_ROSCH|nr:putative 4-coumarate--CoA ligase [Rosa chinensis]